MIPWIPESNDDTAFPDVESAAIKPDGLLAAGGSLSPARLLMAYQNGIFPWFSEGEPILWWSPSKRAVIFSKNIHISTSMQKCLRQKKFTMTRNKAFAEVINACAAPRNESPGTWITAEMINAYCRLHELGYAHSFECWLNEKLVGGIYGVKLGRLFCGESMFSRVPNASKAVLIAAAQADDIEMIDCQIQSAHLARMGATEIARSEFIEFVYKNNP